MLSEDDKKSLVEHQKKIGELWDADPNCWHKLDPKCSSGGSNALNVAVGFVIKRKNEYEL